MTKMLNEEEKMMLEKKTKRELALDFMENFRNEGTCEDEDKIWVSQESLVKFILSNYTIERRGGQGIANKNRPKRLIDIELLFKELKGVK